MDYARLGEDLDLVVDYFLDQVAQGDSRPPNVVEALCELRWPERRFRLIDFDPNEGLVCADAFVDEESGQTVYELLVAEQRLDPA